MRAGGGIRETLQSNTLMAGGRRFRQLTDARRGIVGSAPARACIASVITSGL
jgi:hypothetical protein